MRRTNALVWLTVIGIGLGACATGEDVADGPESEIVLGPKDGLDLGPIDLDRVQVGDPAPDFSLTSLAGPVVTLSDFRSEQNVVLVFYRGHW